MVDTLITIGIIAFVLLRAYSKSKRRAQQQAQRRPKPSPFQQPTVMSEPEWETLEPDYREEEAKQPTSYEEIPKNSSYFTYESIEPEINGEGTSVESYSEKNVETNVQNIENEDEKKRQISIDLNEMYKGVIYSEILKRPYN